MFRSVRTKLVLSHAAVIFLCLLLAGLGAVVLIARYQRETVLSRRRAIAVTVTQQVQTLVALRVRVPEIASLLTREAERLEVRLLLLGPDAVVLADTVPGSPLTGRGLPISRERLPSLRTGAVVRQYRDTEGQRHYLILSALRAPIDDPWKAGASPTYVVLAVPEPEVRPPWGEIASPLLLAGGFSLLLSLALAILLSRSVTQPLVAMTRASEEMAQGNYQQEIPATGQDEVARLASSFNRMAREVERSRQAQRDFVANVSHDLKTPLTSIQGFAQALQEGAVRDPEGYQRAAQIISEEASRMGQLVQDLLNLARLESGSALQNLAAVSVHALLQVCERRMAPLAAVEGPHVEVTADDNLPAVWGDAVQLEQALFNVIDNAVKYTPAGGRVAIRAHAFQVKDGRAVDRTLAPAVPLPTSASDGAWIAISVTDTGAGIPPEELPRVFERFYRADKSRSGFRGWGLGLAITREIIEAHAGAIGVTSQIGQGSCFTILLPSSK